MADDRNDAACSRSSYELMSVAEIIDKGHEAIFKKTAAYVRNESQEVVVVAERQGDLYYVNEVREKAGMLNQKPNSEIMDWHVRLGHLNEASWKMMVTKNLVLGMKLKECQHLETCEISVKGKHSQTPFSKRCGR